MRRRPLPSQEYLNECLVYERDTGRLFWRVRPISHFHDGAQTAEHNRNACNGQFAGREAFTATTRGYATGGIDQTIYRAHRVIWKMVHGEEPVDIDHINGDRRDNRLCNLRAVTRQENTRNAARRSNNTSGTTGVHFDGRRGKWIATIKVGALRWLGSYDNLEDARSARKRAEQEHGFHENHGRDPGHPVATVTSDREAYDFLKSCGAPQSGELV